MATTVTNANGQIVDSRAAAVFAVTVAMISCSFAFVSLRLGSRIAIVKRVTIDDYFIIVAWLIAFGLSLSICFATRYGLGLHEVDIPNNQKGVLQRLEYSFSSLYNPALMATKTSILAFYLTLSRAGTQKVFRWTSIGTLVVVNAAGLALTLLNIFQCRPLSTLFDDPKPEGASCTDFIGLYLSSAPLNITTDLIILLLPMPVLKAMRLPRKQKLILYITFGFGVFVTAVDIVRISNLQSASFTRLRDAEAGRGSNASSRNPEATDFSWYAAYSFMWSAVEVNVGIMCACVPALKPLVTRFMPKMLKDSASSSPEKRGSAATLRSDEMAAEQRVPSINSRDFAVEHQNEGRRESNIDPLSMIDFITTPDMAHLPPALERSDTIMTNDSGAQSRQWQFFDFVNVRDQKSIVYLTNRESIRPIAEVTFVFFLWGFAYGLLNTLNGEFQIIAKLDAAQSIGIHSAYYAGYLVGPLSFGRLVLKHWGFKACYIIGLIIYGVGTLVFWPAAVLTSFSAFLISNFIVGMGLSTLEIAANPFTALCGPPEYAEIRLNLSQAFQAIGTVSSPLLAKKVLFKDVFDVPSLVNVQWTYLGIALFVFVLAFVYYIIKMPEATDEELEEVARKTHPETLGNLRRTHVIWITLTLACFAQFLYLGGQEAVATSLASYVAELKTPTGGVPDYVNYEAIGHALFAASRFLSALIGIWIKPRHQLLFWFLASIIFSALSMNFTGLTSGVILMCVFFLEGPIFALIYAIPLRGLGKYTRDGSALMTAAISGGGVFPPIMHAVAKGRTVHYANCVVVACAAFGSIFPLYLNSFRLPKQQVDPCRVHGEPRRYSSAAMTSNIRRLSTHMTKRNIKKQDSDSEKASCSDEAGRRPSSTSTAF